MNSRFLLLAFALAITAASAQDTRGPAAEARAGRRGPWDNDVMIYSVSRDGLIEPLGRFGRSGVPTIARLADGRLIAAHQHFPADLGPDFDKVAVHFSTDEGREWTAPQIIQVTGLPDGMRFPFDPTLVPLPDGRVRLYFTGTIGRRLDEAPPAIHSAISRDGVNYDYEPGVRFGVESRIVIDCAVVLHRGVFHLYAPDNGPAGGPRGGERPREGRAYHATSPDGLTFTRVADVQLEDRGSWLGNAQSDGKVITFYGSGAGLWAATSEDGAAWKLTDAPAIRGGDPGAVAAKDGGLIVVITGEPRGQGR